MRQVLAIIEFIMGRTMDVGYLERKVHGYISVKVMGKYTHLASIPSKTK